MPSIEEVDTTAAAGGQDSAVNGGDPPVPAPPANANANGPVTRHARVVLPDPVTVGGADSDAEDDPAEEDVDGDENDILADLPDDSEDVELVHTRLTTLEHLRLERFGPHLQRLCLRENFLSHLDPAVFQKLTQLEDLDLYDNRLKSIGNALVECKAMTSLDLSFNNFKAVPDTLQHLTALKTVYFVQNRITKIAGLDSLGRTLRSLELGGNRIRTIENLDALVNLEELWLGKNKITKLQNLSALSSLRILSIQSNRITAIEGLDELHNLEELYLSHNGVKKIEGLEKNVKLKTLDVARNFVSVLEGVAHLEGLEELWLNGNQIPDLSALEPQLRHIASLETIYLEANPVQATEGAHYRRKIMLALPQLKQIDAT